jgi:hypothetical protein
MTGSMASPPANVNVPALKKMTNRCHRVLKSGQGFMPGVGETTLFSSVSCIFASLSVLVLIPGSPVNGVFLSLEEVIIQSFRREILHTPIHALDKAYQKALR